MNADISDNCSLFANHIAQFCKGNHLILTSEEQATSWLDRCISAADAHASLGCMGILYGPATADHIPFSISINVEDLSEQTSNGISVNAEKLNWSTLTKKDKHNNKTHNIKRGWNEYVAEYRAEACEAFKLWTIAGRLRQGSVLEYKKLTNGSMPFDLFVKWPRSLKIIMWLISGRK